VLNEKEIIAPDWCTLPELMEILNDTSWAYEYFNVNNSNNDEQGK